MSRPRRQRVDAIDRPLERLAERAIAAANAELCVAWLLSSASSCASWDAVRRRAQRPARLP